MIVKRGANGRGYLLIVFSLLLSSFVLAQTGEECAVNANSLRCGGVPITTPGFGAVELCQVCFQCGVSDGICPESYSDGIDETNSLKTIVNMRVSRPLWNSEIYSVAFRTGNLACQEIGGDCLSVERSTDGVSWTNIGAGECSRDVSFFDPYNNAYFRARCDNVPRKAGCEYCPDPDCENQLSGYVIDAVTGAAIDGATISINSPNNSALDVVPAGTSTMGTYTMDAVTGVVNITCTRAGFEMYSRLKYLSPGRNIFDCSMNRLAASCEADCHIEDGSGIKLCRAECDEQNGCQMSPQALGVCAGLPVGQRVNVGVVNYVDPSNNCAYTNITTLTCCEGTLENTTIGVFTPGIGCGDCFGPGCTIIPEGSGSFISGDVSSIITRNYRKEFNGVPVTLKIIVYDK